MRDENSGKLPFIIYIGVTIKISGSQKLSIFKISPQPQAPKLWIVLTFDQKTRCCALRCLPFKRGIFVVLKKIKKFSHKISMQT